MLHDVLGVFSRASNALRNQENPLLKQFVEPTLTSARKASRSIGNTTHIPQDESVCNGCG
jgi:hypothetical protein